MRKNNNKSIKSFKDFKHLYRPCNRGDIFYFDFGKQVGSLQSGVHPVVIIQNNRGNEFSPTTIVAPVTSQNKRSDIPTHARIMGSQIAGLKHNFCDSIILFKQIFTINKKSLINKVGRINLNDPQLKRALEISIGLTNN